MFRESVLTIDSKDLDPTTALGRQKLKDLKTLDPLVKHLVITSEPDKKEALEASAEEAMEADADESSAWHRKIDERDKREDGRDDKHYEFVSNLPYDTHCVQALSALLGRNNTVESLTLDGIRIGIASIGSLALSLQEYNRTLQFLEMNNLVFTDTMTNAASVRHLDERGASSGLIANALSENPTLTYIKLHTPLLDECSPESDRLIHAGEILYQACQKNVVKILDLSGIALGCTKLDKAIDSKLMQESIAQNTTLKVLALQNLGFPGLKDFVEVPVYTAFLKGLRDNKHLEILDLSRYVVTDEMQLEMVRGTELSEESFSDIIALIEHNKGLRAMSIQGMCLGNQFNHFDIKLAEALAKNATLLYFDATNNKFSSNVAPAFIAMIRQNRTLRRLELFSKRLPFHSWTSSPSNSYFYDDVETLQQAVEENGILSREGLIEEDGSLTPKEANPESEVKNAAEAEGDDFISRVAALNSAWVQEREPYDKAGLEEFLPIDDVREILFDFLGIKRSLSPAATKCLAECAAKKIHR